MQKSTVEQLQRLLSQAEQENSENTLLFQKVFSILQEKDFKGVISTLERHILCEELNLNTVELSLKLLPMVACYAHPVISHFSVGAIAIGVHEDLYFGANQEFIGTPISQSIHAEQSAIAHAWILGEQEIVGISVNHTPCGHCRQFMQELNSAKHLKIHLPGQSDNLLSDYLPNAFGPADLGITESFFSSMNHRFTYVNRNPMVQEALKMLNRSYAPYSKYYASAVLRTLDGEICKGAYVENAAFNPSFSAILMAINHLFLSGYSLEHIKQAILMETPHPLRYQQHASELLKMNSGIALRTIKIDV